MYMFGYPRPGGEAPLRLYARTAAHLRPLLHNGRFDVRAPAAVNDRSTLQRRRSGAAQLLLLLLVARERSEHRVGTGAGRRWHR